MKKNTDQQSKNNAIHSHITIYTPESSLKNPFHMIRDIFNDLYIGRELAWRLAVRDHHAHYRQAALGFLWAFFLPLAHSLTWILLSASKIVTPGATHTPYWIYVLTGTILWTIFMDSVNAPLQQINASKQMLAKVKFPREALIISGIYQTIFNASIRITLILAILILTCIFPEWTHGWKWAPGWALLWFPFGILSLILAGTAIGLLITPVGMLYTDIGKALPLAMQFLMYLSPVVFAMPKIDWAAALYRINPLTPLLLTTRDFLTGVYPEYLGYFFIVNLFGIALLLVVWIIYRAAMPILIERMSA